MIHSLNSPPTRPQIRKRDKTVIRKGVIMKESVWVDQLGREYTKQGHSYALKPSTSSSSSSPDTANMDNPLPFLLPFYSAEHMPQSTHSTSGGRDNGANKSLPAPIHPLAAMYYQMAMADMILVVSMVCLLSVTCLIAGFMIGRHRSAKSAIHANEQESSTDHVTRR